MRGTKRGGLTALLAIALGAAPKSARADGPGSVNLDAVGVGLGVIAVGLFAVPVVYDVDHLARNAPPDSTWALAQSLGGAAVGTLVSYVIVTDAYAWQDERHRRGESWVGLPLLAITAGLLGGYGTGALVDPSSGRAGGVGAVSGMTAFAVGQSLLTLNGIPRERGVGVAQALVATPGIAVGLLVGADASRTEDRALAYALAGISALAAVHGVVDAIVHEPNTEERKPRPEARVEVWPTVAPMGRAGGMGVGVGGRF